MENTIFSEKLTLMMSGQGLSQDDLSRKTGISQATISRYLHGKNSPGLDHAMKISSVLKTTIDSLINFEPVKVEGPEKLRERITAKVVIGWAKQLRKLADDMENKASFFD